MKSVGKGSLEDYESIPPPPKKKIASKNSSTMGDIVIIQIYLKMFLNLQNTNVHFLDGMCPKH